MVQAETGETKNPTAPDRALEEHVDHLERLTGDDCRSPLGEGDLGWQGSGLMLWEHEQWKSRHSG